MPSNVDVLDKTQYVCICFRLCDMKWLFKSTYAYSEFPGYIWITWRTNHLQLGVHLLSEPSLNPNPNPNPNLIYKRVA